MKTGIGMVVYFAARKAVISYYSGWVISIITIQLYFSYTAKIHRLPVTVHSDELILLARPETTRYSYVPAIVGEAMVMMMLWMRRFQVNT